MSGPAAKRAQKRKRILVAEDDPSIAQILQLALSKRYDVEVAVDGPGALARANRNPPDLAIFDVMMPGIDGLGVAERFKMLPHLSKVPLIFLTAKDDNMARIRAIQQGARHYILKPFQISDVLAKVKKIIGD